jgi:hypothetical protein
MAERIFVMTNEPNLEDLLRDDIMTPVLRSANVTPDELRRQLLAAVRRASRGIDATTDRA